MNHFYKFLNFMLNKILSIFLVLVFLIFIGLICFSNRKINEQRHEYDFNKNIYMYMIFASRGKEAEKYTNGALNDAIQTSNSSFMDKLHHKFKSDNVSNSMKKKICNVLYTSVNKQKLHRLRKEQAYNNKLTNSFG